MQLGRVKGNPYCNCFLLYILLLDVFCSTIRNLVEYKLLFRVAILQFIFVTISAMTFKRHSLEKCLFLSIPMVIVKYTPDSISYY